jgi:hypothetical protein
MREIDMRRWWLCGLLVLLLLLTSPAGAREILQGDQCLVPARETIDDDLFVLCRTLEIDGVVTGNVLGIATTAEIDGRIGGNLYLAAGQLDVTGSIGENLHFFGAALRLSADARFEDERADILSLGLSTTLERGAQLPDGIIGAGYQLVVDGNVGGDIDYWGSALHITGSVAGDIDASVGDSQSAGVPQLQALLTVLPVSINLERPGLQIDATAQVDGQLRYSAPSPAIINVELAREPEYTQVSPQPDLAQIAAIAEEPEDAGRELALFARGFLTDFLLILLLGWLLLRLTPQTMNGSARRLNTRPLANVGWGVLVALLALPVLIVVLLISVGVLALLGALQLSNITFGVTVLLIAVNLGLVGAFYVLLVFVARIVISLWLGRWLLARLPVAASRQNSALTQLAVGAAILALLVALPTIGWWLSVIGAIFGLGALLGYLQSTWGTFGALSYPSRTMHPAPRTLEDARQYPPPMLDGGTYAPGMDNLPDGFRWWDSD